jgi:hypothetical protein
LDSDPRSRALLSGSWTAPRRLVADAATADTTAAADTRAHALVVWEQANLSLCRFIRATLALNVRPFVRRHAEARTLWDALVRLFGEPAGVAMVGGPSF